MKKLSIIALLLLAFSVSAKATSTTYTLDVASYPVTEVAFMAAEISGNAAVEHVFFSNSSTATAQTVSVYKDCASTTTATLVWRGYIPAGTTVNTIEAKYSLYNMLLHITDACFRKSDAASSIQVNVVYR